MRRYSNERKMNLSTDISHNIHIKSVDIQDYHIKEIENFEVMLYTYAHTLILLI